VITQLPRLAGTVNAGVTGINASGTVIGFNDVPRWWGVERIPVVWQDGVLSTRDFDGRLAVAINDFGSMAVGVLNGMQRSYVLTGSTKTEVMVPGLSDFGFTAAVDLNNSGQVCGKAGSSTMANNPKAFLWQPGGGSQLPVFPYDGPSEAVALNNHGHVVGYAYRGPYDAPALLWRAGAMTVLNELPEVLATGWTNLTASDINDQDQIVGWGYRNGNLSAFLLSPVTATPAPFSLTIKRDGSNLVLSFPTAAGFSYQIQSSVDLSPASWVNEGTAISGTGGVLDRSIPIGPEPAMYFRLRID
jgi:uncharacterized membrane protein